MLLLFVIPAKAGIQLFKLLNTKELDSRLRGSDEQERDYIENVSIQRAGIDDGLGAALAAQDH